MNLELALDPCTHCGACLSFCTWDAAERENRPAGPDLCRDCQVCYRICPRLPHEQAQLAAALFPTAEDAPWGRYSSAHTVRVTNTPAGVQDGGITSKLAGFLLETGQVEAVLVTGRSADWRPQAYWATDPAGVAGASGSKYSTAPALAILQEGLERFERVALIALPCQSAALARLGQSMPKWRDRIALVIGLFCTKSFYHGGDSTGLVNLVEERVGRPLSEVERFDIKRGWFTAQAQQDIAEWRIKELDDIVWPICRACQDLTAEYADLSIGSIGSPEGSNTVIVRSQRAMSVMKAGGKAGLWVVDAMENPAVLKKQCDRKRGNPERLSAEERTLYGRRTVRGNWKRRMCKTG